MDEKYIVELTELRQTVLSLVKRTENLEDVTKKLSDVYIVLTQLTNKVENTEKDMQEVKSDVKELKSKPAKRWDKVVELVIGGLVSLCVGYLFGSMK